MLRGRIEVLENANDTLRKQQRDLYGDLDKRDPGGPVATAPVRGPRPPPAGIRPPTTSAFDTLKGGKYADSLVAFKQFLQTYPQSLLADNAQYWLGESYLCDARLPESRPRRSRPCWIAGPPRARHPMPPGNWATPRRELQHTAQARATLASVSTRYPGTDAANLAAARLLQPPAQ